MRFKVWAGALTRRDVRNEATTGDMYENTSEWDKMSIEKHGLYTKLHRLTHNRQQFTGLHGRKCRDYAIDRGEVAPTSRPRPEASEGSARANVATTLRSARAELESSATIVIVS
jgi:hypothetical protein